MHIHTDKWKRFGSIAGCIWVKDPYVKICILALDQTPLTLISALASPCKVSQAQNSPLFRWKPRSAMIRGANHFHKTDQSSVAMMEIAACK